MSAAGHSPILLPRCAVRKPRLRLRPSRAGHQNSTAEKSRAVITALAERCGVNDLNRIKPGIAEATRAVLRQVPDHVFVRDCTEPDVELLLYLARQKGITITEAGDALGQYRAVTIIRKVSP